MRIGWGRLEILDKELTTVRPSMKVSVSTWVMRILGALAAIYFLFILVVFVMGGKEPEPKFSAPTNWGEQMLREAGKW